LKHEFPQQFRTVYTFDESAEPPAITFSQCRTADGNPSEEERPSIVTITEEVMLHVIEHLSGIRPDFAKAAARIYWRAQKRPKKKVPFHPLDDAKIVTHDGPMPGDIVAE